jgi:hypothetical protein
VIHRVLQILTFEVPNFLTLGDFAAMTTAPNRHADAVIEPLDKNRLTASSLDSPSPDE